MAPRPPRPRIAGREPTVQRGIIELSLSEAQHLVHQPLTLTDGIGRTIGLPAGAGHGDEITLFYDGGPVILTIQLQRKT